MISVTQAIDAFASECLTRLESWSADQLPNYRDTHEDDTLWERCLASAADYFSVDSVESRLLQRGIAVHHGKMPGPLARRLKMVIDRGYVRVIIATSTLSEGVNIPVTYLLIPSVFAQPGALDAPGVLKPDRTCRQARRIRRKATCSSSCRSGCRTAVTRDGNGPDTALIQSVQQLAEVDAAGAAADNASSALAMLLLRSSVLGGL